MNGRIIYRIFLAIVLLAVVAGLGVYAYNLGIAQGVAQSGNLPAPSAGAVPYYPYFHGPFFFWPFGFPVLLCLVPLLFFGLFGILFCKTAAERLTVLLLAAVFLAVGAAIAKARH